MYQLFSGMRYTLAVQDEYKEVFKPNGVPALKKRVLAGKLLFLEGNDFFWSSLLMADVINCEQYSCR